MLFRQRLKELEDAQQVLLVQAELQRTILRLEGAALRRRADQFSILGQSLSGGSPWLVAGAVLGGFLAFRRWRRAARWVPAALTAWRWLRRWLEK